MIFLRRFKKYTINSLQKTQIFGERSIIRDIKINNLCVMESQTACDVFHIYFVYKNFSYEVQQCITTYIYIAKYFKNYLKIHIKLQYTTGPDYNKTLRIERF
jgi:hypothetical protein